MTRGALSLGADGLGYLTADAEVGSFLEPFLRTSRNWMFNRTRRRNTCALMLESKAMESTVYPTISPSRMESACSTGTTLSLPPLAKALTTADVMTFSMAGCWVRFLKTGTATVFTWGGRFPPRV